MGEAIRDLRNESSGRAAKTSAWNALAPGRMIDDAVPITRDGSFLMLMLMALEGDYLKSLRQAHKSHYAPRVSVGKGMVCLIANSGGHGAR